VSVGALEPEQGGLQARRLFVALVPPPELRASLLELARGVLAPAAARLSFVHPEDLHLTLAFLGRVLEADRERLEEELPLALERVSEPELRLSVPGIFPGLERPRVLWFGVRGRDSALDALHGVVRLAVERAGLAELDRDRPFHPHLTVARARRGKGAPPRPALEAFLELRPEGSFRGAAAELRESRLGQPGPHTRAISVHPLRPPG
jgi:2'-5' RNA ligase